MFSALFRQEVLSARHESRFGQAVFFQPPTVRWMVFFLIVVFVSFLIFAANAALKQTVRVRGYLTPTGGEVKVYGGKSGVVTEVFVDDGDVVKAGDILVSLADPQYDHEGRAKAGLVLQQIDGQLQQLARRQAVVSSRFDAQAGQLRQQIQGMQITLQLLKDEQQIRHQRVALSGHDLDATRRLRTSRAISEHEYRQVASSLFLLQQQAKAGELAIAAHLQAMADARQQLKVLPLHAKEEKLQLDSTLSQLRARRHELRSQLGFTITAPRDGIVSNMVTHRGDIMDTRQPLLTLLEADSELEAWLYLPSRALADIEAGSQVMISYDAYPHQTYGSFPARVYSVADSAMDPREFLFPVDIREPVYLVRAHIDDQGLGEGLGEGLGKSSANRFRPGMQFTADIVTGEHTILDTLTSPLSGLRRRL
ncbi:MAG: hypothetical protein CMQ34_11230 [Gammaproteobacteria bacterium]|nr:hypothetical protein [Gammaproteobacteria bacterium]|tara:strand:- start:838 stop:2106 length:1269 start_codon:yes stop_codon:yes gene_type:complete